MTYHLRSVLTCTFEISVLIYDSLKLSKRVFIPRLYLFIFFFLSLLIDCLLTYAFIYLFI